MKEVKEVKEVKEAGDLTRATNLGKTTFSAIVDRSSLGIGREEREQE